MIGRTWREERLVAALGIEDGFHARGQVQLMRFEGENMAVRRVCVPSPNYGRLG
jgi:hypothetical protein